MEKYNIKISEETFSGFINVSISSENGFDVSDMCSDLDIALSESRVTFRWINPYEELEVFLDESEFLDILSSRFNMNLFKIETGYE